MSEVQRESQPVLDSIKEMASTVLLKRGVNDGIAVCIPKETILNEMAAKIKLSQALFFCLVREPSDGTSYKVHIRISGSKISFPLE
jgi:hypothetical protein